MNSLDIAVGEAAELENWLYKLRDAKFVAADVGNVRIRESIEVQKMLHGLIRRIERSEPQPVTRTPRPNPQTRSIKHKEQRTTNQAPSTKHR